MTDSSRLGSGALGPLDGDLDGWSLPTLRRLAWLSRCAYHQGDELPERLAVVGQAHRDTVEAHGTTAVVSESPAVVVVAFRGTEFDQVADILTDLAVRLVDAEAGRVHEGFQRAVEVVWPALSAALPDDGRPLWFTGHSMGGALAQIAAARLGDRARGAVSFGSPRVGDEAFAAWLSSALGRRLVRVAHDRDPVPELPPRGPGYRHAGHGICLLAAGGHEEQAGPEGEVTTTPPERLREAMNDRAKLHLIPHYEAMLQALLEP